MLGRRGVCGACCQSILAPSCPQPGPVDSTLTRRAFVSATVLLLSTVPASNASADVAARPALSDVTRSPTPALALQPGEQAVVSLFERTTYSVANVVDATLASAPRGSQPQADVPEGNGSGFVWDSDGHIVTNYHVLGAALAAVAQAPKAACSGGGQTRRAPPVARVTLLGQDGRNHEYVAELVGADRPSDIAVLRVNASQDLLRPLPRGKSSTVRVGQAVLCIGNPFGFEHTLTSGVVSGLDRRVASAPGSFVSGGIQTDAAINPGNSGGVMMNSAGQLIGMNTAIFTPTGLSSGVGFAIPVDTLERIVPQLISSGRVVRPSLDATLASDAIATQLRVRGGALVQATVPGGAADAAGLLPTRRGLGGIVTGDVIVGLDDQPVRSPAELEELVEKHAPGDAVRLSIVRGVGGEAQEQLLDVTVTLGAAN